MKEKIVKNKSYLYIRYCLSFFEFLFIIFSAIFIKNRSKNTVYCISPYKTASTFVSGLLNTNNNSKHEPYQHLTLLLVNKAWFLGIREKVLGLDFEASGFLSLNKDYFLLNKKKVVIIYRDFFSWCQSLINHQSYLASLQGYPYTSRLLVDKICHFKIESFIELDNDEKEKLILNLYEFWYEFYNDQRFVNDNVLVIDIKDIDARSMEIKQFCEIDGELIKGSWKRESASKLDFNFNEFFNKMKSKYEFDDQFIKKII